VRIGALIVGSLLVGGLGRPARAEKAFGAPLPEQVRPVETGRFHSQMNWERTERWFRRLYGSSDGIIFRRLETAPEVEGWYIQNLRPGRPWDGIHVYRTEETIHIVVLPARDGRTGGGRSG